MIQQTQQYKGPHRALGCQDLGGSSKLQLPIDLPIFRRDAGPHKFAAAPAILGHLCTQLILQVKIEQLKLSKTDPSTWL
jgi:hypothetical protein